MRKLIVLFLLLAGLALAATPCSHCGGNGRCWTCGGTGQSSAGTCSMCSGNKKCWYCSGTGEE